MATDRGQIRRVLLAQSGDREALDGLLRDLQGPLFGYLAGLVGDRHLAEDVLQDAFVLICRKLAWLREPEVFRPWAYRIASREAFRRLRKERRRGVRLVEGSIAEELAADEEPEAFEPEWLGRIPELIGSASPASRAVLMLHYLEGLSLDEVAAVLDLSPGTVKSRLSYGLAALRRKVGCEGPPPGRARSVP